MNENASYILKRLSQREWLRVQALGFPVSERGRIAIANLLARSGEREIRQQYSTAVLLIRGAIRLRVSSVRKAAAQLGMPWRVVRQRMNVGATVNGWRVRRAA
jgi:hypothetical protein